MFFFLSLLLLFIFFGGYLRRAHAQVECGVRRKEHQNSRGNEMPKSSDTSSLAVGQVKEGREGKGRKGSAADRELPQFD